MIKPEYLWAIVEDKKGITLRDYFAAAALPSILSSGRLLDAAVMGVSTGAMINKDDIARGVAGMCYEIADAMLKARGQV